MNVILEERKLRDLMEFLAATCWGDQYVEDDGMLNALASYLLTNQDVSGLLLAHEQGATEGIEELAASLYDDDRVHDTLLGLVNEVRNNIYTQLGTTKLSGLQTQRGIIIVSIGANELC